MKAKGVPVSSLSSGKSDFPTPEHVVTAAHMTALAGDTKLSPPLDGTDTLRNVISHKFRRDNQLDYPTDQITVAGSAKQIIFNAMLASCNPGDEVSIPSPGWGAMPI